MKSFYIKSIIFSLLALTIFGLTNFANAASTTEELEWIPLQVNIPVPNCDALGENVQCSNNSITAVKDFPALVVALYSFGVVLMSVILFFLIVVGGLMYLTSAGESSRAQKGIGYIKNSLYALIAVLLSYFILNTINPSLTKLEINNIEVIEAIFLCEELSDEKSCNTSTEAVCAWTGTNCIKLDGIDCSTITDMEICKAECKIVKDVNSRSFCVADRKGGDCNLFSESTCAMAVGCVLNENNKSCALKDLTQIRNQATFNACDDATEDACRLNGTCEWRSECVAEEDILQINCAGLDNANCTELACFWDGATCQQKRGPNARCIPSIGVLSTCIKGYFCDTDSGVTCQPQKELGQQCSVAKHATNNNNQTIYFQCKSSLCIDDKCTAQPN